VFSKYKDGEERNKYYLQHTLCVILLSDTSVSTEKKVELLRGIDADFRKPLIIDSYIEGPNVNFGCEESNSSTVRYQAPPDFHLVNAFASVSPDTTGTKHTSAEITDRSSVEATAVAKFQGQDRVFFNCPGGGHGAIRLTYQIASN
jgi:hypothetical protein